MTYLDRPLDLFKSLRGLGFSHQDAKAVALALTRTSWWAERRVRENRFGGYYAWLDGVLTYVRTR